MFNYHYSAYSALLENAAIQLFMNEELKLEHVTFSHL